MDATTAMPPFGQTNLPVAGGVIVENQTGLPLDGVHVRWVVVVDSKRVGRSELGETVSDIDGSFSIVPADSLDVRRALCAMSWQQDTHSVFLVDTGAQHPLEFPIEQLLKDKDQMVLRLEAPTDQVDDKKWTRRRAEHLTTLAGYMAANRMIRVNDLTGLLKAPPPDAPSRDWTVMERVSTLDEVGRALGSDPANYTHLLNLDALLTADLKKAVSNFKDVVAFKEFGGAVNEWHAGTFFKLPKSDLELYRDYLVGVWVAAARQMHAAKASPPPSDAALGAQLATRFHQDFATGDVTTEPVHPLLADLLRQILLAPASRAGYGLAIGAIAGRAPDQTDTDYVQALIEQTGESAAELQRRFRVRFDRPSGYLTSPVALNVETLLGLLSDTWQSPIEPFPTTVRGIQVELPLIFPEYLGRAPFFLQYEEWLERQRRFFPENIYDIHRVLPSFSESWKKVMDGNTKAKSHPFFNPNNDYFKDESDWIASARWVERMFPITDTIRQALALADKQDVNGAHGNLDSAAKLIEDAIKAAPAAWKRSDFVWYDTNGSPPIATTLKTERHVSLKSRAAMPVTTREQLAAFEAYFDTRFEPSVAPYHNGPQPGDYDWEESWMARARTLYVNEVSYIRLVLIPYLRATFYLSQGEFNSALKIFGHITGCEVGFAEMATQPGYRSGTTGTAFPYFHQQDSLPYTVGVEYDKQSQHYAEHQPLIGWWDGSLSTADAPVMAPFERQFFCLAQGDAMLAWADDLYRNDDSASIRRARELYKGVIFLHGEDPRIAPHFQRPGLLGLDEGLGDPLTALLMSQENPARASQLARARGGFEQIELGLNAYGFREDMVPLLRYSTLKQSADLFAASAKSAQSDFLQYQIRFETAVIEGWQTAAMVKKAKAASSTAAENVKTAAESVKKAKEQVEAVKAQIAAKQKENNDADSFFNQAKDFFGGIKDSLSGLASSAKGVMNDSTPASKVSGEALAGMIGKSVSGGSAAKDAMAATLGSGGAMVFAFGAFAYYGYTSMEGMEQAANKRSAELKALQDVTLAAANAQVMLKERDATIAANANRIAEAELGLAQELDRFQRERFLNVDFWNKLSAFSQRTMRRYVELGARAAWLAERALAFEQNRALNIVRLNYLPSSMRGISGADRLQLDLAELEAHRISGARLAVPVKHTYSLARDFPIAFGILKLTGRCTFHTFEPALQATYPGTYGYRLRAVTVAAQDADGPPPRGMLRNLGASTVSSEDGQTQQRLLRFPDALPLSEFRLHDDLWVYGLPGEALLQFEGSGIGTDWELDFPIGANPKGTRTLIDVVITMDMKALYSQTLADEAAIAVGAVAVSRAIVLAASVWDPIGLAALRDPGKPARVRFDLEHLTLPLAETNRVVANLALIAVGSTQKKYQATLKAENSAKYADMEMNNGLALSNAGALQGTAAPMPLNAIVGLPLAQAFVLELTRNNVQSEIEHLQDLVLWVEYCAQV
ncbi:UNVERIFIED_ORG: hypothetical protein J2W82_001351 [Pseudomonas mohnii]|nr:hypothetical protein [Pseudomonas mohnii]